MIAATSRLAADVLRHRLVLTYEALADGVDAVDVLGAVFAEVDGRRTPGRGAEPCTA